MRIFIELESLMLYATHLPRGYCHTNNEIRLVKIWHIKINRHISHIQRRPEVYVQHKNSAKIQILYLVGKPNIRHTFWSWLIRFVGMNWCIVISTHNTVAASMCINTLRSRQNGRHFTQTILSSAYSWEKMSEIWLKFHWSSFLRVQLTIFQHCFR